MNKQEPIDPASTDASLEMIHNNWENAMEEAKTIQTKADAKVTFSAASLIHMLIAGRFPWLNKLSTNQ